MFDESITVRPPVECTACRLGRHVICRPNGNAEPDEINVRRQGITMFDPGKLLARQGETVTQSMTLYSGWAYRFRQLADGRRQILSFAVPGDLLMPESAFFPDYAAPYSIKSLTRVSICIIPLKDMMALMHRSPEREHQFKSLIAHEAAVMRRLIVDLGKRSALGRVSQLILELYHRLASKQLSAKGQFHFPVRQEQLADAVGLTPVYVNRTLDRLRQKNLIAFDRQRMTILDVEELHAIAEEE